MSALNVIVQQNAVHMLTDGAAYDEAGRLVMIGPKAIALPHLNAAIAVRGPKIGLSIFADVLAHTTRSYDHLRDNAVVLLRRAFESTVEMLDATAFGSDSDFVIAGFPARGGPEAFIVSTHGHYGMKPWTRVPLINLSVMPGSPEIQAQMIEAFGGRSHEDLDPESDGLRILELQRSSPQIHPNGVAFYNVGGFAQLTTITREAVTSRIIHRWPDEIGKKIKTRGVAL